MTGPDEGAAGALFDVEELHVDPARAGRAEAGLLLALRTAERDKLITELDAGAVGAALVAARALDRAERLPDKSAVYAVAQSLTPYRELLHALRLPTAVAPASGVPLNGKPDEGGGVPSWLSDGFGTAE